MIIVTPDSTQNRAQQPRIMATIHFLPYPNQTAMSLTPLHCQKEHFLGETIMLRREIDIDVKEIQTQTIYQDNSEIYS
jgi:hypothetical protein